MTILVSALEPSANDYLVQIAKYLPQDTNYIGIGVNSVVKNPLYKSTDFSIMGLKHVIPKLLFLKRALKHMVRLANSSDMVLLIDAPAFNLRLAKAIKKQDNTTKIVYYILPKVWAWNRKRIDIIERYTNCHIAIFPFEKAYYPHSLYLGNPLMDKLMVDTSNPLLQQQLADNKDYIAFMPGSRVQEIKALLPLFKEVAQVLCQNGNHDNHTLQAQIVIPAQFDEAYIKTVYGDLSGFVVINDTKKALARSSFAFICSGTATLEATIIGVPFILVYRLSIIDYIGYWMIIKRRLGGYIGLANIIGYFAKLNTSIHPEFINTTAKELITSYQNYDYDRYQSLSTKIKNLLQIDGQNTFKAVADKIQQVTTKSSVHK